MPSSYIFRLFVLFVLFTLSFLFSTPVASALSLPLQEPLTNDPNGPDLHTSTHKLPAADTVTQFLALQHQLSTRLDKHGKTMFKHQRALSQSLMKIGMSIGPSLLDFPKIREAMARLAEDEEDDWPLFPRQERRSRCMRDIAEIYHTADANDGESKISHLCTEEVKKLRESVKDMHTEMHDMEEFMLDIGKQIDRLTEEILLEAASS
jgi:hypothetical protein